jgi:hypothetical protein
MKGCAIPSMVLPGRAGAAKSRRRLSQTKVPMSPQRSLNNSNGVYNMKNSIRMFVLALSAYALMMATGASAEEQLISRPLKMTVQSQQVIHLTDGSIVAHAEGVSSHLGIVAMDTSFTFGDPVAYGTITAANGDLVYWEWQMDSTLVTITGGTGRFQGADGEFVMEIEPVSQEFDPVANTITNTYIWTALGTISY